MNFSTYRFTLDLQKHQSQMSIAAFQYDTAVKLSIGLTDGGVPYYLEDGCIAVLWGKKANGEPISHKCSIESNTKIIYEFNKETADEIGVVDCQIRLYKDGEEKITAPKFIIVVAERVTNDAEVFDAGDGAFEEQFSALDNLFTAESGRVIAENARVEAEKERQSNELLRKEEELSRIEFETQRQTDEVKRVKAEEERTEAEDARVEAEKLRQVQYDYLLGENNKLEEYKQQSKEYADGIKNDLLNGAGEAYDTLKELGDALEENKDIIDTLASKKFLQDTLEEYDMTVVQRIASTSDSLVPVTTNPSKIYGTDANGNQTSYPLAQKSNEYGIALRHGGGYLGVPNPTQSWHATPKEYVDKKDNEVRAYADSRINPLEERVTDLESLTLTFTEDTSTDYEKAVPAEVGKYALVKMIGGATKKVSLTKNILDPKTLSFWSHDSEAGISYTLNADGTITYTIAWGGFCSFGLHNFPVGRYCLYLENASIDCDYEGNIDLALSSDYDPESGNTEPTTKTLKVMLWLDESVTTENYEIREVDSAVFEPYIPILQDAEVERIESIGADGETLLDSIAIPEAVRELKMVTDTYYDYIEFVDDKVFGYKVADEIVLNGTETWKNNGDMTSPNNYYLTIVTSDKTKYVSGQVSSDRYDFFDLGTSNREVGIDAYVSNAFGGFAIGIRPHNVTSYTATSFREYVKANPITIRLALATPEVKDITDLFTEDNKLQVQQGGAIRFVNEQKMAIPNTVAFIKRKE